MLLYPHYGETATSKTVAVIASCTRCGDRKRFDVVNPGNIRCNCKLRRADVLEPKSVQPLGATVVEIHARKTAHKCDARCINATGPNCNCSCGGENHGRNW